jgi:hypothetical protein
MAAAALRRVGLWDVTWWPNMGHFGRPQHPSSRLCQYCPLVPTPVLSVPCIPYFLAPTQAGMSTARPEGRRYGATTSLTSRR